MASARTSSRSVVRVVAEAALGRAAGDVVLDAVAREDADRAVVELDREVDRELALRDAQDLAQLLVEVEVIGGGVELGERRGQGVLPGGDGGGGPGLPGACWPGMPGAAATLGASARSVIMNGLLAGGPASPRRLTHSLARDQKRTHGSP